MKRGKLWAMFGVLVVMVMVGLLGSCGGVAERDYMHMANAPEEMQMGALASKGMTAPIGSRPAGAGPMQNGEELWVIQRHQGSVRSGVVPAPVMENGLPIP